MTSEAASASAPAPRMIATAFTNPTATGARLNHSWRVPNTTDASRISESMPITRSMSTAVKASTFRSGRSRTR